MKDNELLSVLSTLGQHFNLSLVAIGDYLGELRLEFLYLSLGRGSLSHRGQHGEQSGERQQAAQDGASNRQDENQNAEYQQGQASGGHS